VISEVNDAHGDRIPGFRTRPIAAAKFAAVTSLPSLNRKPLRIVNV
jgi:hypothetical protein